MVIDSLIISVIMSMIHGSNLLSNVVGIGSSLHDLLAICLITFEMYSAETG